MNCAQVWHRRTLYSSNDSSIHGVFSVMSNFKSMKGIFLKSAAGQTKGMGLRLRPGNVLIVVTVMFALLGLHCAKMQRVPFSRCEEVNGLPGPSDMALESRSAFGVDRLILATQDRRDQDPQDEYLDQGAIKFVPLTGRNRNQVLDFSFSGRDEYPFHPEAIDLLVLGGSRYLFVLNHARVAQHAVEIFRIEKTSLVFMGRFRHRFIEYPSDIVGLGLDEFYVLNRRSGNFVEHYGLSSLFLGSGSLIYYRDGTYYRVLQQLSDPEGLALSPDQTRLWISEGGSGSLIALERGSGPEVRKLARVSLTGHPARLSFSGADRILVATIPSTWAWSSHESYSAEKAPSRILQVDAIQGTSALAYQDPGNEISGATIALAQGNRIFLGQKFDSFILICNQ